MIESKERRAFILPGMGADHSMYSAPAWRDLACAHFLDWPEYHGEKSISAIADRVIEQAVIPDAAIVIGSSLGGIVACEIAQKRRLESLVLIGSAMHPGEISGLLTMLHPLATLAPIQFIQAAVRKLPSEIMGMFSRSQAEFIRAACLAIFDWPGLDQSRIKPIRLHGKWDRVIPLPPQVDLVVDGGHLIAMTNPEECVGFLKTHRSIA